MLKTLVRWLGIWLLAAGFVGFVIDGVRWLANREVAMTPLGTVWYTLDAAGLNTFQAVVERYTLPVLWDPVMIWILQTPAALVAVLLGLALIVIGRKRQPTFPNLEAT